MKLFYFIETVREKFLIKKSRIESSISRDKSPKQNRVEINSNELESDLGLRKKTTSYNPNDVENVWRAYLLRGPNQPHVDSFPVPTCPGVQRDSVQIGMSIIGLITTYLKTLSFVYFVIFTIQKKELLLIKDLQMGRKKKNLMNMLDA